MSQKIVIIGGVAAGPKAAARARRVAPDAEITIVERGGLICNYDKVLLIADAARTIPINYI